MIIVRKVWFLKERDYSVVASSFNFLWSSGDKCMSNNAILAWWLLRNSLSLLAQLVYVLVKG